jgi:hypothetical protein
VLEPGSELHGRIPAAIQAVIVQRVDRTRVADMSAMDPGIRAQTLEAAREVARLNEEREQQRAHLSSEERDLADMADAADFTDAVREAVAAVEAERQRKATERAKAQAARRRQNRKRR